MKRIYIYKSPLGGTLYCFLWLFIYIYNGGLWFSICRYGLQIENRKVIPPLFSERNGFKKPLRIGKWAIKGLK